MNKLEYIIKRRILSVTKQRLLAEEKDLSDLLLKQKEIQEINARIENIKKELK